MDVAVLLLLVHVSRVSTVAQNGQPLSIKHNTIQCRTSNNNIHLHVSHGLLFYGLNN